MNATFENLNLHIEKASGKDSFIASVQDDRGNVLAKNEFQMFLQMPSRSDRSAAGFSILSLRARCRAITNLSEKTISISG
ncbi:MAG: hypothetical protein HZC49_00030 [Nitrospirae bacterium]|nr:hypothetical protein [Nitrospirota bacterium]